MTNTIVPNEWPADPSPDERERTRSVPPLSAMTPGTDLLSEYRVRILEDRWDEDSDRFTVTVRAFGPLDANLQVKTDYPSASILQTEKVVR